MSDIIEDIIERNRREAAEEATREVIKKYVIRMLQNNFKYEDIAQIAEITIDEVLEIEKQASMR